MVYYQIYLFPCGEDRKSFSNAEIAACNLMPGDAILPYEFAARMSGENAPDIYTKKANLARMGGDIQAILAKQGRPAGYDGSVISLFQTDGQIHPWSGTRRLWKRKPDKMILSRPLDTPRDKVAILPALVHSDRYRDAAAVWVEIEDLLRAILGPEAQLTHVVP